MNEMRIGKVSISSLLVVIALALFNIFDSQAQIKPPLGGFILTHPENVTQCEGVPRTVSYGVTVARNTYGYLYQWLYLPYKGRDWLPVSDIDKSIIDTERILTLEFSKVSPLGALTTDWNRMQFKVLVTENIKGGATEESNPAFLYVNTRAKVTKHPASAEKNVGESVTFSISASGTLPRYYQWQFDPGTEYEDISGATGTSYTIMDIQPADEGRYRCRVSNLCGTSTSSGALLTVNVPMYDDGWFAQVSGTSKDMRQVTAVDEQNLWAVTVQTDQLMHTDDGGETWVSHFMQNSSDLPMNYYGYCIWFNNLNTGYVGGWNGYVYSTNGGDDWSRVSVKDSLSIVSTIYTKDIFFIDDNNGWIVGDLGLIAATTDGGTSWSKQNWGQDPLKVTDANLKCVYFLDSDKGWAGGENGVILYTEDGGEHWTLQESPESYDIIDIHFLTTTKGFAAGSSYKDLYYTNDAGTNWLKYPEGSLPYFYPKSVVFTDPDNGWLAGYTYDYDIGAQKGSILRTNDGGATWHMQYTEAEEWLNHIIMINDTVGCAVGNSGEIQRTVMGGCLIPTVNLFDDVALCASENYTIIADSFDQNLNCEYLWNTGDTLGELITDTTGLYSVVVTNLCGKTATDDKIVEFYPLPPADAGEDIEMCYGDTIQLLATGGELYSWSPKGSLNFDTIQNPLAFPVKTTNYTVYVTDTNMCVNYDNVMVTVHSIPTSFFSVPGYACDTNKVSIIYTGSGSEDAHFSWNFGGGDVDTTETGYLAGWDVTGLKTLWLVVEENECFSDTTWHTVSVNNTPTSDFETESGVCGADTIIVTYLGSASGLADYDWTFESAEIVSGSGQGPYEINWNTGGTYEVSLSVTENNCTSEITEKEVIVAYPFDLEEICIVTIDSATSKNLIVFEKTPDVGIESYNIYRETDVAGKYAPIGNIPVGELSVFVDMEANPEEQQYLYKISAIDTCGNESGLSDYHKTLFLQYISSEGGVNLRWDKYEIEGVEINFESYLIYRGSDSSALELVKTISGSNISWTDTDPVAGEVRQYYRIAGVAPEPCDPANLLGGKKAGAGPYSHSISNLEDNRLQTTDVKRIEQKVTMDIYPNPFSEVTQLTYHLAKASDVKIEVYNLLGARILELVSEPQTPGDYMYNLSASDIGSAEGIFYIRFTVDGNSMVKKVILTR
jgi:photosystem II stability/assembly factor-like uncharacterized protein